MTKSFMSGNYLGIDTDCSGLITSISFIGIPTIAVAPTEVLVRQWKTTFDIGKANMPPLAVMSAACFGFLAYASRGLPMRGPGPVSPSTLYTVAAIIIPAIVPYTLVRMEPAANQQLNRMAAAAEKGANGKELGGSDEEVKQLLKKWSSMNLVRAGMVGTGAVLGAVASLVL